MSQSFAVEATVAERRRAQVKVKKVCCHVAGDDSKTRTGATLVASLFINAQSARMRQHTCAHLKLRGGGKDASACERYRYRLA